MSGWKFPRPSAALVVACVALAFSLSGVGYAALTLPSNSVGTKQLKRDAVTTAKIRANAVIGSKIKNGQVTGADVNEATLARVPSATFAVRTDWAKSSEQLAGVAAAEYATRLWAHVSAGTLSRGEGVTFVGGGSTGVYTVRFNRSIRNCAAFATISADGSDYSSNGVNGANGTIQAYTVIAPGVESDVQVVTTLPDGRTRANYDFNVMVMC